VSDAAETAANDQNLVVLNDPDELPPILAGHLTPQLRARAESFFAGVAELFERWVARRPSHHTQRAYRRDVLSFVDVSLTGERVKRVLERLRSFVRQRTFNGL
jgi:hypothetical protein